MVSTRRPDLCRAIGRKSVRLCPHNIDNKPAYFMTTVASREEQHESRQAVKAFRKVRNVHFSSAVYETRDRTGHSRGRSGIAGLVEL